MAPRGTAVPPVPARAFTRPAPDTPPVYLVDDPRRLPPPGNAVYVFRSPRTTIVGPASATLTLFRLGAGATGVLREVTYQVRDLLNTSDITFRLLVDGAAIPGYIVPVFPRTVTYYGLTFTADSTFIDLPAGARVTATVTVADAGTYLVGVEAYGWSWTLDLKARGRITVAGGGR